MGVRLTVGRSFGLIGAKKMIFVLVHGGFHGGWCWKRLIPKLEAEGHRVYTPTLTGLGERAHLARADVGLETHIEDILAVYRWEDLTDTVLVGHSYGGMVVGAVADRIPDKIRTLIYLDAIIPADGMSVMDFYPPEQRETHRRSAADFNGWQIPAPSTEVYGITDPAARAWADERCVPHPLRSLEDKASLGVQPESAPKTVYVRCTGLGVEILEQFAEVARSKANWDMHFLETGHDCMITAPADLVAVLLRYSHSEADLKS